MEVLAYQNYVHYEVELILRRMETVQEIVEKAGKTFHCSCSRGIQKLFQYIQGHFSSFQMGKKLASTMEILPFWFTFSFEFLRSQTIGEYAAVHP